MNPTKFTHMGGTIMADTSLSRQVAFNGNPVTLEGTIIDVGDSAPGFTLVDSNLGSVSLADFRERVVVLITVPSLDTPVCDMEARRFDQEAEKLGGQAAFLVVSMDLPFAQQRWCGAADTHHVMTLSDYKDRQLGKGYGIYMAELGLLARAVFIIDTYGIVRYREIVPEVTHEPNYAQALSAVKALLQ